MWEDMLRVVKHATLTQRAECYAQRDVIYSPVRGVLFVGSVGRAVFTFVYQPALNQSTLQQLATVISLDHRVGQGYAV